MKESDILSKEFWWFVVVAVINIICFGYVAKSASSALAGCMLYVILRFVWYMGYYKCKKENTRYMSVTFRNADVWPNVQKDIEQMEEAIKKEAMKGRQSSYRSFNAKCKDVAPWFIGVNYGHIYKCSENTYNGTIRVMTENTHMDFTTKKEFDDYFEELPSFSKK